MVYELSDTSKAAVLFGDWPETLVTSCLQKVMGKVYVTDLEQPKSALAFVGCFAFFAGEPDKDLVVHNLAGFVIMTPQNGAWAELIEKCLPSAKKVTRYAIRKDTKFDTTLLEGIAGTIPAGYELRKIDAEIYDLCLKDPVTRLRTGNYHQR